MINPRFLVCGMLLFITPPSLFSYDPDKKTFKERIASSSFSLFEAAKLRLAVLKKENIIRIRDALILGMKYGKQAKEDEENNDKLAHEKAAYEWGYDVGDPKTVRMIRFYWEGIQLGVFAIGDHQERSGEKPPKWKILESLVGGNGKEYEVNKAYIDDIFQDVKIATDGAEKAKKNSPKNFEEYAEKNLKKKD